jgi:hypothetical protein
MTDEFRRQFLKVAAAMPLLPLFPSAPEHEVSRPMHEWRQICRLGGGRKQCRYLNVEAGYCSCLKMDPESKQIIDEEVEKYMRENHPPTENVPLGDNCFPGFKPDVRF